MNTRPPPPPRPSRPSFIRLSRNCISFSFIKVIVPQSKAHILGRFPEIGRKVIEYLNVSGHCRQILHSNVSDSIVVVYCLFVFVLVLVFFCLFCCCFFKFGKPCIVSPANLYVSLCCLIDCLMFVLFVIACYFFLLLLRWW